jgi:hypothetical protein
MLFSHQPPRLSAIQVHPGLAKLAILAALWGISAVSSSWGDAGAIALQPMPSTLASLTTPPSLNLPVSLANGSQIAPPQGPSGHSELTIENGNDVDAVVKLVDPATQKTLRFVYVQAGQSVTLEKLGAYSASLKFALGLDWDEQQTQFRRAQSFMVFDDPLTFKVEKTNTGELWTTYTITLHSIAGGNATTEPIDAADF